MSMLGGPAAAMTTQTPTVALTQSPAAPPAKKTGQAGDEIALVAAGGLLGLGVGVSGMYALTKRTKKTLIGSTAAPGGNRVAFVDHSADLNAFPTCKQEAGDNHCGYYAALTMTKGRATQHSSWDGTLNRFIGMMQQCGQHLPLRIADIEKMTGPELRAIHERETLRPHEIGMLHNTIASEIDGRKAAEHIYFVPIGTHAYVTGPNQIKAFDFDDLAVHFRDEAELKQILKNRGSIPARCSLNDEAFLIDGTAETVPTFTISTARAEVNESGGVPHAWDAAVSAGKPEQHSLPKPYQPAAGTAPREVDYFVEKRKESTGHAIPVTYENGGWYARDPVKFAAGPCLLHTGPRTPESARLAIHNLLYGDGNRAAEIGLREGESIVMHVIAPRLREKPQLLEHPLMTLPAGTKREPLAKFPLR